MDLIEIDIEGGTCAEQVPPIDEVTVNISAAIF